MKVLFYLLLLSLYGNEPSRFGIAYRELTWQDFRGPVPANEPTIGARSSVMLVMEPPNAEEGSQYRVMAYFQPDSSFVRQKNDKLLRHEQTHFKIAYIEAIACMQELPDFEGEVTKKKANAIYNRHVDIADEINNQFDAETNHGLNLEAEKQWEDRISLKLHTLESSMPGHGRNQ